MAEQEFMSMDRVRTVHGRLTRFLGAMSAYREHDRKYPPLSLVGGGSHVVKVRADNGEVRFLSGRQLQPEYTNTETCLLAPSLPKLHRPWGCRLDHRAEEDDLEGIEDFKAAGSLDDAIWDAARLMNVNDTPQDLLFAAWCRRA